MTLMAPNICQHTHSYPRRNEENTWNTNKHALCDGSHFVVMRSGTNKGILVPTKRWQIDWDLLNDTRRDKQAAINLLFFNWLHSGLTEGDNCTGATYEDQSHFYNTRDCKSLSLQPVHRNWIHCIKTSHFTAFFCKMAQFFVTFTCTALHSCSIDLMIAGLIYRHHLDTGKKSM